MKYLSVCSGVEAATVAWHDLGWKPIAFSEIEPFPSAVLSHRFPTVPNMGDMTKYKEWNLNEPIDLLVGGTPCQSFSVAGLRKGLEDPRGNLMLTYVGLLDKFRPKWCIWENVPGVLSSNEGRDFGAFLGALVELGYGFAYRVLDAQHFGVPQRRRRVFVVACFGDWTSPAKVLFEPESLRRDPSKSKGKKQSAPAFTSSSFGGYSEGVGTIRAAGGDLGGGSETLVATPDGNHTTGSLLARDYKGIGNQDLQEGRGLVLTKTFDRQSTTEYGDSNIASTVMSRDYKSATDIVVYENHPSDSRVKEMGNVCQTVTSSWGTGGGNIPFVQPIALAENTIGRQPLNGGNGTGFTENGPMYTLNATGVHGVAYGFEPGIAKREGNPSRFVEDGVPTLRANMGDNQTATAYSIDTYNLKIAEGSTQTLRGFGHIDHVGGTMQNMAVRRLTPIECERLQGFPDDYTNIKEKCPDGPRYKAMGNSMAVPVMRWIGERIDLMENARN
jgi:DNA (cytosine-5)-methyltransferase 1